MGIELPQVPIQPAQFQPPNGIIESYLSRPTPQMVGAQQLGQGIDSIYKNQVAKNQLAIEYQKAQAEAQNKKDTGMAALLDAYGTQGLGLAGYQSPAGAPPQQPQSTQPYIPGDPNHPNSPIYSSVNGQGHPDFAGVYSQTPQPQPDNTESQAPQGQGFTTNLPTGYVPPPGPGHPSNDATATPTTANGSNGSAPTPDLSSQVAQYAGMGNYGRKMIQSLQAQGELGMLPARAKELDLQSQKAQGDIAMQPTEMSLKQQQLANAQQDYKLATTKPLAEEASRIAPKITEAGSLRSSYNDLLQTLGQKFDKNGQAVDDNANFKLPFVGGAAAALNNATGGKWGDKAAGTIDTKSENLGVQLDKAMAGRYNEGETHALMRTNVPNANDSPQRKQQKLQTMDKLISVLENGNQQALDNFTTALNGGRPLSKISTNGNGQTAQVPDGRITIKSPTGQIGHIPQSQLKEALAAGYTQQ